MKDILQVANEDGSIRAWSRTQFAQALVTTSEMSRVTFIGGNSQELPTKAVADFLEIPVPTLPEAVAGIITVLGEPQPIPGHVQPPR